MKQYLAKITAMPKMLMFMIFLNVIALPVKAELKVVAKDQIASIESLSTSRIGMGKIKIKFKDGTHLETGALLDSYVKEQIISLHAFLNEPTNNKSILFRNGFQGPFDPLNQIPDHKRPGSQIFSFLVPSSSPPAQLYTGSVSLESLAKRIDEFEKKLEKCGCNAQDEGDNSKASKH